MDQSMPLELVFDTEATAAHVAGVRFFAGMLGNVYHQWRPRAKELPAVTALERKHVRVRAIVCEQRRLLLERLAAYVAHVWSLAGVYAPVILDVAPRREHATTEVARYILDTGVSLPQMPRQALIYAEALAAQVAGEESLACMYAYVPVEGIRRIQILPALTTMVINLTVVFYPSA